MENIKHIQTFKFDKTTSTVGGWIFDMLIPGKDQIDVTYDEGRDLFMYSYRGQYDFDVASIRVENKSELALEAGQIDFVSALEDRPLLGESLLCNIVDKNRGVVITVLKGVSSGGISVSKL
ncbi:MAG: hypothetical protein ISR65_09365 [Bacteriovoracaceae bacterium]|nr:hypothetical protein [Bacteriovoracaceae bacterium]